MVLSLGLHCLQCNTLGRGQQIEISGSFFWIFFQSFGVHSVMVLVLVLGLVFFSCVDVHVEWGMGHVQVPPSLYSGCAVSTCDWLVMSESDSEECSKKKLMWLTTMASSEIDDGGKGSTLGSFFVYWIKVQFGQLGHSQGRHLFCPMGKLNAESHWGHRAMTPSGMRSFWARSGWHGSWG